MLYDGQGRRVALCPTFFAQAAQPVFAHDGFVSVDVSEWTTLVRAAGAQEELAHADVRLVHVRERQRQCALL